MTIYNFYVNTKKFVNVLKIFIGKLRFPRTLKFKNDLDDAFREAVKETSQFDESVRELAQTWLAVCPYTYFSELFLETKNWNAPFVHALERSDMANAKICYELSQSFYLRNLFSIIEQDENYREYSRDAIIQNIRDNMNVGRKIIDFASDFEKDIKNMKLIDDFSMCYVEKILKVQYPDENEFEEILNSLLLQYDSLFGLVVFITESLKRAKYIDSQGFQNS